MVVSPVTQEPKRRDRSRAHGYPEHLVVRLHLVTLEQLVLEVMVGRGNAIRGIDAEGKGPNGGGTALRED